MSVRLTPAPVDVIWPDQYTSRIEAKAREIKHSFSQTTIEYLGHQME